MATGGITASVLGASDEVLDMQCEICQKIGNEREAKHFCENCNTCICDTCKSAHNRIPDLSQHMMSTIENDCGLCLKEGNKNKAYHFCKTCKSYICSLCFNTHKSFDALQHHIIVSGKSLLRRCVPSASEDVSNKFSQLSTREMSKCPTDTTLKSNERNESRKSTQKSSKPAESVVGARSSTTVPSNETSTVHVPSNDTSTVPSNDTSTVASTDTPTEPSTDTSLKRQTKPLAEMTVRTSNEINIKLKNDINTPGISGCCFLPGGELVLCDENNSNIKLLNLSLTLQDSLPLQGKPHDVADLDGSNIAVTLPYNQQVQIIQLLPTVKIGRTVSVGMECYGIAVAGDEIYVSGKEDAGNGQVNVYDIRWKLKRSLGVDQDGVGLFRKPRYIAVSRTSGRVFVSDFFTDTVTCLSSDNKVLWRYNDDTLRSPDGLYVDNHDNIIVCNFYHSVDIITAEGKRYKTSTLLSSPNWQLKSVTFRPDDQTLVVGCSLDDEIYVYKLS